MDEYGTQQPIALLKLLFEKGGFYDRGKDLNWKNIKDVGKYQRQYLKFSRGHVIEEDFLFILLVSIRQELEKILKA